MGEYRQLHNLPSMYVNELSLSRFFQEPVSCRTHVSATDFMEIFTSLATAEAVIGASPVIITTRWELFFSARMTFTQSRFRGQVRIKNPAKIKLDSAATISKDTIRKIQLDRYN